jgi:hypothetical protein
MFLGARPGHAVRLLPLGERLLRTRRAVRLHHRSHVFL